MKKLPDYFNQLAILVFCFLSCQFSNAQTIDQKYQTEVVQQLNTLLEANYVFKDVAIKTTAHLNKQLKAGAFASKTDLSSFAEALTQEVQSINKDKHMRIWPTPPYEAPENTPERLVEEHLNRLERGRSMVGGFKAVKKLDGNVGYFDLRGFAPVSIGAPIADQYMSLLSTSDAIIVDLRKNGGGSPAMVQYLCSYFFDERVHLNSLYWRQGDRTQEFWTLDEVGGKKLPDVPLFVLTSSRTFSGAEEFSYNMQTRKRATLVGETTGGGANPGGGFSINPDLTVFIPTGAAVNPVTGTNWEGVGVIPEVKTSADDALDKALELAKVEAEKYKGNRNAEGKNMLLGMIKLLGEANATSNQDEVVTKVKAAYQADLVTEDDINQLGYIFMQEYGNSFAAEALFKSNTVIFPNSANVYDSYAEALIKNGKLELGVKNYKKAVKLAETHKDPNMSIFKENLAKAEQKLNKD
ncbi:MAG: S41 family peptidase [Saprospiraceae bacterium]|nr:S41 family peptidase [Saprospiraceae bacterium]